MQNPLAHEQGKCVVVKSLPYKHKIMIGDGFTDLEVRLNGYANTFVAFTEHAYRADIAKRADIVLRSGSGLDQLI
jgi:D-3-phosphoglycerate dehydrogenase